ncbi:MAG: sugar phosphate isomerase/epimerase [Lentisphaerae bacterium]|jgi:3-oxoisoapionate decarboxylase|nr:sugar phosphate isomerase/epimerase [Lentisphaerota bacterium]MBT4816175.1 sugar phosphate isomerase/epimerase [Lentisphaerota bacterium]MBT5612972.1 sugar phosphate isomerase/epimerase [Lentisphaerota bacterium]MBT7059050.1 sugar phosphate isomerase/epimerase [Lentisphaerota bacterium]MBT7846437.1 sugar phosphate isomerase/epimerase [Lentisphaerota bacterium]
MNGTGFGWDRRRFLLGMAAAGAATALPGSGAEPTVSNARKRGVRLGFDNFSIRAFDWKAPQLIEYAASLRVDTLLLSELGVFESLEHGALAAVGESARMRGLELQIGTGSICSTSKSYKQERLGPAADHLRLLIRTARAVGATVARCYLGTRRDRQGPGGIYPHIEETVKVCRAVHSEAQDAGVRIAIENHAGDLQAWELAELIETAGKDVFGATIDAGNATWTLEDPLTNLAILGPHALATGMRDSAVWETDNGAAVMWVNMGQGVVDWNIYLDRFQALCPDCPFVLETCGYAWQHEAEYLKDDWWTPYPRVRANEFARFVALAKRGRKFALPNGRPVGPKSKEMQQRQQKWDLEQSLSYCRNTLGLGLR